jgi:predicted aspartyl protease
MLLLTAAPPATLTPDAEARWVSFTLTPANQIRFEAQVDGQPVAALLDTGVTNSTVSRRFADAAKLRVDAGAGGLTVSGRVTTAWTTSHAITFGPVNQRGARLAVADLPKDATGGDRVDLLVGTDVTARYALDIDYDGRRFRLLPSGRMPFRGTIAPLRIAADWGLYVTEVTVAGTRVGRVVVDTGDGTALSLARRTAAALPALPPVTSTLDYAIGGTQIVDLAVLPEIRSGMLTLRNVELRIEPTQGFAEATGMAGRIGSGILQHYRVLLDPGARRMVLFGGPDADRPPQRSTSGFLLGVRPGRLDVLHVMRGSPAERAGWVAGDTICSVDGVAITPDYARSQSASWPVGTVGRTVRLVDCTGRKRPVTLRQFY